MSLYKIRKTNLPDVVCKPYDQLIEMGDDLCEIDLAMKKELRKKMRVAKLKRTLATRENEQTIFSPEEANPRGKQVQINIEAASPYAKERHKQGKAKSTMQKSKVRNRSKETLLRYKT